MSPTTTNPYCPCHGGAVEVAPARWAGQAQAPTAAALVLSCLWLTTGTCWLATLTPSHGRSSGRLQIADAAVVAIRLLNQTTEKEKIPPVATLESVAHFPPFLRPALSRVHRWFSLRLSLPVTQRFCALFSGAALLSSPGLRVSRLIGGRRQRHCHSAATWT